MSEFKISKVMLLAALIKFELENNRNVDAVKMWAGCEADAVKEFNIYVTVNGNTTTEIELSVKDRQVEVIISTRKPIRWSSVLKEAYQLKRPVTSIDVDHITLEAGNLHPEASRYTVEKTHMPLMQNYNLDSWRSMARDVVGMALKEYNSNK
jgi:hypothetical protein